jgi:hypothetical protein
MAWWQLIDRVRLWWDIRHVTLPELEPRPSSYGWADGQLLVGDYQIASFGHDEIRLLAVLRDEAITVTSERVGFPEMIVTMPGRQVADRLDLLGIDDRVAAEGFDDLVRTKLAELDLKDQRQPGTPAADASDATDLETWSRQRDREALRDLDSRSWIERVREAASTASPASKRFFVGPAPEDFWWLLILATGSLGIEDLLVRLRLVLLAFPDLPVTARVLNPARSPVGQTPATACSSALRELQAPGAVFTPTVVLTEGPTDARFLGAGLEVLYPHLTDLVRFMDFHSRPQTNAGELTRMVKAFAAARITNRIVAIFDNDAAATDAMRQLARLPLPANIAVRRYPHLALAERYPTRLGADPDADLVLRDVNGVGASIELYLGTDVLTDGGSLAPIGLTSNDLSAGHPQGEVINKQGIQKKFMKKARTASAAGGPQEDQDWSGIDAILTVIINAHRSAAHS